VKFYEGEK